VAKRKEDGRRDRSGMVTRAIQRALGHLPKSVWANKKNQQGLTVHDVVDAEVEKNCRTDGRLGSRFWSTQVFTPFNLVSNVAAQLPDPDEEEPLDMHLIEMLEVEPT
jgi:hypothetical protein